MKLKIKTLMNISALGVIPFAQASSQAEEDAAFQAALEASLRDAAPFTSEDEDVAFVLTLSELEYQARPSSTEDDEFQEAVLQNKELNAALGNKYLFSLISKEDATELLRETINNEDGALFARILRCHWHKFTREELESLAGALGSEALIFCYSSHAYLDYLDGKLQPVPPLTWAERIEELLALDLDVVARILRLDYTLTVENLIELAEKRPEVQNLTAYQDALDS